MWVYYYCTKCGSPSPPCVLACRHTDEEKQVDFLAGLLGLTKVTKEGAACVGGGACWALPW